MKRRDFMFLIGGATVCVPLSAYAQQSRRKIPVVGVLWHAGSAEEEEIFLTTLRKAFNDLGYVEGKNIVLDHRFPAENPDRFRTLAQELVEAKVDVLIGVVSFGAVEPKEAHQHHPNHICRCAGPGGRGTCGKSCPAGRQCNRAFIHDDRLERKTSVVIEGCGSKPFPCRSSDRHDRSVQRQRH